MRKLIPILCSPWFFLASLFAITLVVYGFAVRQMGFYWDDWLAIYLGHQGASEQYWAYYAYDRPLSAWTYLVTYPLFGSHPAAWQLFSIFLRWLTSAGMWIAMVGLWPRHRQEASWMAVLLAVYPGFTQQSISVAYSQHLISYASYTISLALMVWSLRRPRLFWPFTILGAVLALLGILTMEYFIGLELLRPFILWFLVREARSGFWQTTRKALLRWLPYLLVLVLFGIYRFGIFPRLSPVPGANDPYVLREFLANPFQQGIASAQAILQDFVHLNLFAWTNTILPEVVNLKSTFTLLSWGFGALVAVGLAFYILRFQPVRRDEPVERDHFVRQGAILGLAGILLGGIPVWATGHQVTVGMWSDRFALAPMFGVVILLAALIFWLVNSASKRALLYGLLLVAAIGFQMRTVNTYRKAVTAQQEFFWQMAWRIPALKAGTALVNTRQVSSMLPEYSASYITSMIYAPGAQGRSLPYVLLSAGRMGSIPEEINYNIRTLEFRGSRKQMVGLDMRREDACLRVLGQGDQETPQFTDLEKELASYSQPGMILPSTGQDYRPPLDIFGAEPAHTWCYYFEKADLARQFGDWQEVQRLDNEATASGLQTKYAPEKLPFIEAYANLGNWSLAEQYTLFARARTPSMEPLLCSLWKRIEKATPATSERDRIITNLKITLQCSK